MTVLTARYNRKKGCVLVTNSLFGDVGEYSVKFDMLKLIKPSLAVSTLSKPISRPEYLKIKNKPTPPGFVDYSGILIPSHLPKAITQKVIDALYNRCKISIYVSEVRTSHVQPIEKIWLGEPVYLSVDHNRKIRGSIVKPKGGLLLPWDKIRSAE